MDLADLKIVGTNRRPSKYPDTEGGVGKFCTEWVGRVPDRVAPDPEHPYVWLALFDQERMALLVYLDEDDCEEADSYEEAVREFNRVSGQH